MVIPPLLINLLEVLMSDEWWHFLIHRCRQHMIHGCPVYIGVLHAVSETHQSKDTATRDQAEKAEGCSTKIYSLRVHCYMPRMFFLCVCISLCVYETASAHVYINKTCKMLLCQWFNLLWPYLKWLVHTLKLWWHLSLSGAGACVAPHMASARKERLLTALLGDFVWDLNKHTAMF